MLISHQSLMGTPMLCCCFFRAVAQFYLHVTVFTKEHVKHANKGELNYKEMKLSHCMKKTLVCPTKTDDSDQQKHSEYFCFLS